MSSEFYFALSNISVLPAWILLIVAPRWVWTDRIVHRIWIPGLICGSWILIFFLKPDLPEGSGIGSLSQFMLYVSSPFGALQIWVQLIVWDLFIGAWVGRDAIRHNIHHGFVVPCLLGVLIFPPLGLFIYFVVRATLNQSFTLNEARTA